MRTNSPTPLSKTYVDKPYLDFEVTLSPKELNDMKKAAKGRFMIWGAVKSNDCPA